MAATQGTLHGVSHVITAASCQLKQFGIAQQNDFQRSPVIGRPEISKRMPPTANKEES